MSAGTDRDAGRGIYRKYTVERVDGSSREGEKHAGCEYFVLDWDHDPFAIPAARAYADACEAKYPELARGLRSQASSAERMQNLRSLARDPQEPT